MTMETTHKPKRRRKATATEHQWGYTSDPAHQPEMTKPTRQDSHNLRSLEATIEGRQFSPINHAGPFMGTKTEPLCSKGAKSVSKMEIPKAKSLTSRVTCMLCSKFFTDPRLLPCLHSFCFKCLTNTMKCCPTCKKSFDFPNGSLSALPKDLRKQYEVEVAEYEVKIKSSSDIACDRCLDSPDSNATTFCYDCCKFLCTKCTQDHTRHREKHKHKLMYLGKDHVNSRSLLDSIPHNTASCQIHSDEVLKFYCETCQQLVCRDCIILKHNNHQYDRVEQMAEKEKEQLKSMLSKATSDAQQLHTSAFEVGKIITQVQQKKESVDELIKSEFKKLHEAIAAREKILLARNREINFEKETAFENAAGTYDKIGN